MLIDEFCHQPVRWHHHHFASSSSLPIFMADISMASDNLKKILVFYIFILPILFMSAESSAIKFLLTHSWRRFAFPCRGIADQYLGTGKIKPINGSVCSIKLSNGCKHFMIEIIISIVTDDFKTVLGNKIQSLTNNTRLTQHSMFLIILIYNN